ncbi:MAG TPA: hypothetical protein VMH89_01885 [Candidatus Acidoferrum sp.]|nr:hypothetical protein [Candidatus Acidoferrum sp.]
MTTPVTLVTVAHSVSVNTVGGIFRLMRSDGRRQSSCLAASDQHANVQAILDVWDANGYRGHYRQIKLHAAVQNEYANRTRYKSHQVEQCLTRLSLRFGILKLSDGYPDTETAISNTTIFATGITPAMEMKMVGEGSQYPWTVQDSKMLQTDLGLAAHARILLDHPNAQLHQNSANRAVSPSPTT